jgi:Centromere DNA-binding protein complex CBF3 subunit, domain 2
MAGHAVSKGSLFLPQAQVEPPTELPSQIFPFVNSAITHVNANHHLTATAILNMFLQLRIVVLQDAAAMLLSSRKHCLFDLPVFQSPAFEDFLNLIQIHQNSMLGPSGVTLEQILPGVCNWLSNLHSDMSLHFTQICESVSGLVKPADLQGFLNHVSEYNFNRLSRATEDATAASTPNIGSNAHVSQYELYKSQRIATPVWNKWFGTHHFDISYNAKCFPGGIDEQE